MKTLKEAIWNYQEADRIPEPDFYSGFRRGFQSMFELTMWNRTALPVWVASVVLVKFIRYII